MWERGNRFDPENRLSKTPFVEEVGSGRTAEGRIQSVCRINAGPRGNTWTVSRSRRYGRGRDCGNKEAEARF